MTDRVVPEQQASDVSKEEVTLDVLRAVMHGRIFRNFLDMLNGLSEIPYGIDKASIKTMMNQVNQFTNKILDKVPPTTAIWLEKEIGKNKMYDIASVTEVMLRIGKENGHLYEDFLEMLTTCIDSIFYSQMKTKKLYFHKYKSLFELIANEMRLDVNGQPSQFLYMKGATWIRAASPISKQELLQNDNDVQSGSNTGQ